MAATDAKSFATLANPFEQATEEVAVETAAKAAIGRDNDVTDTLDLAIPGVGMLVLGMCLREMRDDLTHLLGVGTRTRHAVLRLAHLGCSDHLHGTRDLLGTLDRVDLRAYLFTDSH